MKKYTFLYLVALISIAFTSCYKDIGNYDYAELEKIQIEGIEEQYAAMALSDTLRISPQVKSTTHPDAEFECFWGIYTKANELEMDTIAHEKDLVYRMEKSAGTWVLVFAATHLQTGITTYQTADLVVNTEFTQGWYVLKDDGENADLDQYLTPDTIVPTKVLTDAYSSTNGKKIAGKAKLLNYLTSYYSFAENPDMAKATKTLMVLTDQDITFNHINNLETIRDFETFAYETPENRGPGFMGFSSTSNVYFAINAGKLRSSARRGTVGLFGVEYDNTGTDYQLSDYAINSSSMNLFYDELSSSFMGCNYRSEIMLPAKKSADSDMPVLNTNQELLYMGLMQDNKDTPIIAYMKDKTDDSKRTLAEITGTYSSLSIKSTPITADQKLYDAKLITTSQDENVIYFVYNNSEVWSRNLSSGVEQLQFKAEGDEEVTMIRQRKYSSTLDEPAFHFNYVMVGVSNAANEYKLHFFTKTAGNFKPKADFTRTGTGRPKDIIYVTPKIGDRTYLQGY